MKNTIKHFIKITFALVLFLQVVEVSGQTLPFTTPAGWSSIVSKTCTGWTVASLIGTTTSSGSLGVNSDNAVVEGVFASNWYNGTGTDAAILTGFNASSYTVQLKLSNGTYTSSVFYPASSGVAFTVNFTSSFDCSGNGSIGTTSGFYTPIDFTSFSIPAGLGVVGSKVTLGVVAGAADIARFVITSNASSCATAPTLSTTTATNTCSTKTNLNNLVTSTLPTDASLVWYTNNTRTGTPYPLASAAGVGTFFGFYYDATNNCYSPASAAVTVTQAAPLPAPTVAANAGVITTCPATTANIVSQVTSTTPSGSSLVWYNNPLRTGTPITATAAPKGLYYAFYFNATTGCYSPASNPVFAAVTSCCTTIGNGVTVTATGTANAGYNVNQTTMTCPTTPFSGAASWTGLSATGTVVYTFSRPVLSAKIFYTAVNSDDIATITTNGGTAVLSNPSCGLRISGTQIQGTVPSGDVFLTVSAASPFTTITVTNTSGTSGWVQGNFCDFEVTTCAAGTAAPTLSATTVSNTCPGTTNLNSLVTSATPAGATLVWFITATPTGTPYSRPTDAIPGTYYAFYFDTLNNCYSPATAAVTATSTACTLTQASTCPNVSVDLTTRAPSTVPSGSTVTYHTGTPATSTNQITTAQAQAITTSGTYYVSFYDAVQACYAPTSWPLVVTITNCCATVSPLIWN